MTNVVSLQATAHKFLAEKYKGLNDDSLNKLVNEGLKASGIEVSPTNNYANFKAYLNLVDFKTIFVDTLNSNGLAVTRYSYS